MAKMERLTTLRSFATYNPLGPNAFVLINKICLNQMEIILGFTGGVLCAILYSFYGHIYDSGVPRYCRCVCTFCFVCVFGGGGGGGVEVFPTPPNKEKRPWKCTHCVLCVLLVTPLIMNGR